MEEASHVVFQGPGPFHLFVAQSAIAAALGNSVTITLRATLPGRGPDLESASFQIITREARELAISILAACDQNDPV
jgi:hypothetical protein